MLRVLTCVAGQHDHRLVALAVGLCLFASYVGVNLFGRGRATEGYTRVAWLSLAGLATGYGIWATHFIAMLAYEPGVPVAYDVGLTVLSLLLAAVITFAGLSTAVSKPDFQHSALAGAIIGVGVAAMHYTGMSALELPGRIGWEFGLAAASVLLGVLFAGAAMTAATCCKSKFNTALAAALLGLAILSLHFTAMSAVDIIPDPTRSIGSLSLAPTSLSLAIAGAAILVLGLSLAGALANRTVQTRDLQLLNAVNNMSHGVVMFDPSGRLVVCNDRYIEMYGLSRDIVKPGSHLLDVVLHRWATGTLNRDPKQYIAALFQIAASDEIVSETVEAPDGRVITITSRPMPGGSWVATHEDVTERRRAQERIDYLAHHDALTGLANRDAFNSKLDEQIGKANAFTLLSIDLDQFKEVNDVFGHVIGDALMQEVSRRMQKAAGDGFLARAGGDEFAIIAAIAEPAKASAFAEQLVAALGSDIVVGGHAFRVGMSVGIALFPGDGTSADSLSANANAALYRAKADGRGKIRFFEVEMDQRLRERRALQLDLRAAVDRGEVKLYFQPQATMNGDIVAFEALLRWRHPTRGLVPPDDFIPLAEENGLITSIGTWVLKEACREAALWKKPIRVGVNLSPVQFRHNDLPALVHTILLETGLQASRLELEVTEGVLINDLHGAASILRQLKALGVRIAMDDFGTGYSSLSYLHAFPFDRIKIDRRFISNLDQNPQSATIVRAVIGLARGLQVPVIAEGVETQQQFEFLAAERCDQVQGYLIGRPEPIEHYADVVERRSDQAAQIIPLRKQSAA